MTLRSRTAKLLVEQLESRWVPANVAPALTTLAAELTANTGGMVRLTGTFTDADVDDPHTIIIDWQDSSPVQTVTLAAGVRNFQVSHLYSNRQAASDNLRSISVILTDQAFADQVVAASGNFDSSDFRMTSSVVGQPTRFTDPSGQFGGGVTPFNAPFGGDEILTLMQGETITVAFPVKVYDRPASQHSGADFLVFGNSFYLFDFNTGLATGGVFSEPGQIEVSQDGINFFTITNAFADTAFPTNGYQNPTGAFDLPPDQPILSDFGLPVALSFDENGLTLSQIVDAYNGSGGGTPIDISSTGLEWIKYVRIHGATGGVEIDALSVVNPLPEAVSVGDVSLPQVDATLGLYVDHTGYFQSRGDDVKWLRGGAENVHGNTWYGLRENGDFFAWNGKKTADGDKRAVGTIVANFDAEVFVRPALLHQASTATLTGDDATEAQTLDETLGLFVGADGFRHGSIGPNVKWLRGNENSFGNTWYFINADGDFFAWNGKKGARGTQLADFDEQLFLDPHLLHDASQATLTGADATQARQLDQTLGLFVDAQGFFPNVRGTEEKWLRGESNINGNPWYFIRATGEFVAWDGAMRGGKKVASGTLLHDFADQVFRDPELLFKAAQPTLPANQVLQARQFQTMLGLFVDVPGYFPNVQGTEAKWLRGQDNVNGNPWYFIRSNGEFVAWNGRKTSSGKKIAGGDVLFQFDAQVFLNPEPLL